MRGVAIAGMVVFATAGWAQAASFECSKAGSAVERAICGSRELSQMDEALAAAYAAAREGLSAEAERVVREGQRDWIDYRDRACTRDARPIGGDYDDDGVQCLANLYGLRLEQLQLPGALGGLRVYWRSRFAAYDDPHALPDDWSQVARKELVVPQIDAGGAEAKAFNAFARAIAAPALAQFDAGTAETESDSNISLAIETVNAARVTLSESEWWYGHGAAHGNYAVTYAHFLRQPMRGLVAEDVFAGSEWADRLKPMIIDALAAQGAREDYWEDLGEISKLIVDPARWNFSAEGITIQFQPYEVAAYAAGAPSATLGWDQVAPFLAPGARALVGE